MPGADSRQANWVDYDNDGDLDLFSAQRSGTNRLFRNDGGKFTDVSEELGLADPRRTVGSCWFDMDEDGDLDVFQANQQADKDTLYRNDGGRFVDVAPHSACTSPSGRLPKAASAARSAITTTTVGSTCSSQPTARRCCIGTWVAESFVKSRRRIGRAADAACGRRVMGRFRQRR